MLNNRLRDLRKQAGMTQEQLADDLGYTRRHYDRIEQGHSPMPPGFYPRAVRKMLKHVKHVAKVLQAEANSDICQEGTR